MCCLHRHCVSETLSSESFPSFVIVAFARSHNMLAEEKQKDRRNDLHVALVANDTICVVHSAFHDYSSRWMGVLASLIQNPVWR